VGHQEAADGMIDAHQPTQEEGRRRKTKSALAQKEPFQGPATSPFQT
jgi:hypothetical protein